MKPSAFLVNFSRGEVVDEKALYAALKTGVIAGAAIDVYDPEPPLNDNPLYELENIILSPHSAALTQECVIRMAIGAAEGVVDVLTGKTAAVRRQPRGASRSNPRRRTDGEAFPFGIPPR